MSNQPTIIQDTQTDVSYKTYNNQPNVYGLATYDAVGDIIQIYATSSLAQFPIAVSDTFLMRFQLFSSSNFFQRVESAWGDDNYYYTLSIDHGTVTLGGRDKLREELISLPITFPAASGSYTGASATYTPITDTWIDCKIRYKDNVLSFWYNNVRLLNVYNQYAVDNDYLAFDKSSFEFYSYNGGVVQLRNVEITNFLNFKNPCLVNGDMRCYNTIYSSNFSGPLDWSFIQNKPNITTSNVVTTIINTSNITTSNVLTNVINTSNVITNIINTSNITTSNVNTNIINTSNVVSTIINTSNITSCNITATNYNGVTWNMVGSKPTFCNVALTANYNDLLNRPTLCNVALNADYLQLINRPASLSAFSNDLTSLNTSTVVFSASSNVFLNNEIFLGDVTYANKNGTRLSFNPPNGFCYLDTYYNGTNTGYIFRGGSQGFGTTFGSIGQAGLDVTNRVLVTNRLSDAAGEVYLGSINLNNTAGTRISTAPNNGNLFIDSCGDGGSNASVVFRTGAFGNGTTLATLSSSALTTQGRVYMSDPGYPAPGTANFGQIYVRSDISFNVTNPNASFWDVTVSIPDRNTTRFATFITPKTVPPAIGGSTYQRLFTSVTVNSSSSVTVRFTGDNNTLTTGWYGFDLMCIWTEIDAAYRN